MLAMCWVFTILENLECGTQGFFYTWKTQVQNYNKHNICPSSFQCLCKTFLDWVNMIILIILALLTMKVIKSWLFKLCRIAE